MRHSLPAAPRRCARFGALLVTPDGMLWVTSEKANAALALDATGKNVASVPGADLGALALSSRGEILIAAEDGGAGRAP